jgi:hypothetical protein
MLMVLLSPAKMVSLRITSGFEAVIWLILRC